jgi:N utilization substance protein A
LEDFAGCVTDDLTGWFETVDRKRVRQDGILDGFDISPDEAEAIIMSSRVQAGWVTQEELDAQAAEKQAAFLAKEQGEAELVEGGAAAEAAAEAEGEAAQVEPSDEAPAL